MTTLGGLLEVFGKVVRIRGSGELELTQQSPKLSTRLNQADLESLKGVYASSTVAL